MKIKYEYKGDIFEFETSKIENAFSILKKKVTKNNKIHINEYLRYLGFNISFCKICNFGEVPISSSFEVSDNFIKINNFKYSKKIYCYGNNSDCKGLKLNSNSFEFISLIEGVSIDEAKKILKSRNKSPFYKENWNSIDAYRKSQSRDINYYINKYGDSGIDKYKKHIEKISYSNSIERYIDQFGEDGKKIFQEISSNKDSMSLKYFLKKNDNDLKISVLEYKERKESVNVSIEKWIKKYGEKEAYEKHKNRVKKSKITLDKNPKKDLIFKSRGITIEKLFNKYGDINIAKEKYYSWITKVVVPITRSSKESLSLFLPLIEILKEQHLVDEKSIFLGHGDKSEYFIRNGENIYFYDFVILDQKIIIEYNGVAFHPKNENDNNWSNPLNKNITSEAAYNKQKQKILTAEKNGFKLFEIWSDEDDKIKKCLDFIKNIKNNDNSR